MLFLSLFGLPDLIFCQNPKVKLFCQLSHKFFVVYWGARGLPWQNVWCMPSRYFCTNEPLSLLFIGLCCIIYFCVTFPLNVIDCKSIYAVYLVPCDYATDRLLIYLHVCCIFSIIWICHRSIGNLSMLYI